MTAQQLIQHLQNLPPETKIVIRGYEDGYNDILELKRVKIKTNAGAHWYEGEYTACDDTDGINAVDLFGENKHPKDDLK